MNYQLAQTFKSKLADAVYADRLSGLVRQITRNIPTGQGQSIPKTFPVACDIPEDAMSDSVLKHLVPGGNPGDKLRTIIYFEDGGVVFEKKDGHYLNFVSSMELVCWINLKKLKSSACETASCSLSGLIAADIAGRLSTGVFNSPPFSKIQVLKISEMPKSPSIFSKYSYDDRTSYLNYPYDYFALIIETRFSASQSCLDGIEITEADC